jgi:hypothetical protein
MVKSKSSGKKESNSSNMVSIVAILAVVAVVAFFASKMYFANSGIIDYQGLIFNEEKVGKLTFYRHTYSFLDTNGGGTINYNLYVRNNPEDNDVPVDGEIKFAEANSVIYFGIDTSGLSNCSDTTIAVASLSQFLSGNQFSVKAGVKDVEVAQRNNLTNINCEKFNNNQVVMLEIGEKSRVTKEGSCYRIQTSSCDDVMAAVEKFEIQSIIDARTRRQNSSIWTK